MSSPNSDQNRLTRHTRLQRCLLIGSIITIFIFIMLVFNSCSCSWISHFVPVDFSVDINIDNQMPTAIKVIYSEHYKDGSSNFIHTSNIILSGQTGNVESGIVNGIGAVPQIVLQAEDLSGNVIWEKTWTGEAFGKLTASGPINIIISPDTNSP